MVLSADDKVIQAINKQIGSKIDNLHQAKRLINHYKIELEHFETKVCVETSSFFNIFFYIDHFLCSLPYEMTPHWRKE